MSQLQKKEGGELALGSKKMSTLKKKAGSMQPWGSIFNKIQSTTPAGLSLQKFPTTIGGNGNEQFQSKLSSFVEKIAGGDKAKTQDRKQVARERSILSEKFD